MGKKYNLGEMFLKILEDQEIPFKRETRGKKDVVFIESFHIIHLRGQGYFSSPHLILFEDGSFKIIDGSENVIISDFEELRDIVFYEWKETCYNLAGDYLIDDFCMDKV